MKDVWKILGDGQSNQNRDHDIKFSISPRFQPKNNCFFLHGSVFICILPSSIIQLDNKTVQNTQQFRYLGAQIRFDNNDTGDAEINTRIEQAKAKFASRKRFFCSYKIRLATRILAFNAEVRSRLTYGCQCWTITARNFGRIDDVYNQFLRSMIRNGWDALKAQVIMTRISGSNGQPRNSTPFATPFQYQTS